jgi:hypothetical protein
MARTPWHWRLTFAAAALAAGMTIWAALPIATGKAGTRLALIVAVATAVLSAAQVGVAAVPRLGAPDFAPFHERVAERLLTWLRFPPWPEGLLLSVLALEALHKSRPWHTGILGVALIAFLFAVHLGETRAGPNVLRRQAPLLAAGLGLLALSVGAAALPGLPGGSASALVRIAAIVAAVLVAAITIPVTGSRGA